jgi:hypothetical protein
MKKKKKKEQPVDRRIQKTKKLLSTALVDLIIQQGYEAVSIKDIIDKANVGRSTFYTHFESKEQLLLSGHDTFKRLLTESVVPTKGSGEGVDIDFLFFYRHMKEQSPVVKALIGKEGGEIVAKHIHAIFAHRIKEYFEHRTSVEANSVMFVFTVNAAASAMISLLVQWVENDMPFTPEEMTEKSNTLLAKMMDGQVHSTGTAIRR